MSATPPGLHSRPTPNGRPGLVKRKPTVIDPLVTRKKPPTYRPPPVRRPQLQQSNGRPTPAANGTPRPRSSHPSPQPIVHAPHKSTPQRDVSGFSDPVVTSGSTPFTDFRLVTTKRQLLEGFRHHVMNLTGNEDFDLQNEDQFTRPVRLHRRDPRALPSGQTKEGEEAPSNDMDKVEREAFFKRKEERQKEREANLAQIAPSAEAAKKLKHFTRKTEQVFRPGQSAEQRQKIQDKFEEKLPWHLEDFNETHCLVGTNQPTMQYQHVALALDLDPSGQTAGRCRIVPVDKWYKFAQKPKLDNIPKLTIEEAEKEMAKAKKDPEWLVARRVEALRTQEAERVAKRSKGLFTVPENTARLTGGRAEDESADLDFDDDFADDEEGTFPEEVKDEDAKIAEKRIKQEQLQANFFDNKDELEVDEEERKEQKLREARNKYGKKLKRNLRRREGNYTLGSDSEEDPYASSSSSTDSEAEQLKKLEEAKLKEEKATLSAAEGKSGASSKGTNTPTNRKEKHGNASDREFAGKRASTLKRPGSPNLSDASGTDASSRKKNKHKHLKPPTGTSTPVGGSRPSSQLAVDPSISKKRKSLAPGTRAGSDSEAAANSDGAASDGGKMKRLKLNPPGSTSPTALSPQGSRSSSPKPGSPPPGGRALLPTPAEIEAMIPPSGILAMELFKKFQAKGRIDQNNRMEFWPLLRKVGNINKDTKVVYQKPPKDQQQQGQNHGQRQGSAPAAGAA